MYFTTSLSLLTLYVNTMSTLREYYSKDMLIIEFKLLWLLSQKLYDFIY